MADTPKYLTEIKHKLDTLPETIEKHETALYAAQLKVDNLRAQLKAVDAQLAATIEGEIDANTGKPRYSNETRRQAELVTRRGQDQDYLDTSLSLTDAEKELSKLKIELNRASNEFSANKHLADMFSSYLRSQA
jgi:chromosome segregation ATPase